VTESAESPLTKAIAAPTAIAFPYLTAERRGAANEHIANVSAGTLSLGILVAADDPSPFVIVPSDAQYATALGVAAIDMGLASADDMCSSAAAHLRETYGAGIALHALRTAVRLLPDAMLTRGDFVADLFVNACRGQRAVAALLNEAADHFIIWDRSPAVRGANQDMVIYSGLAALRYTGRSAEYETAAANLKSEIRGSPWLSANVARIEAARAGDLEAISIRF
jgi:hypothetical protein